MSSTYWTRPVNGFITWSVWKDLDYQELIRVYLSLIRPICEYACPVWSSSLTQEQQNNIESIQKRALHIISPGVSYEVNCEYFNIPTLRKRREVLCMKFFNNMKDDNHVLNHLLPPKREHHYQLRSTPDYAHVRCKTERYKNSFVPWCVRNESWTVL